MKRTFGAIFVAVALAAALPTSAGAAPGFANGVAAGEVTKDSAQLWARATQAGDVRIEVASDSGFAKIVHKAKATASPADDLTVQRLVHGLRSNTRYWYRFVSSVETSDVGTFAASLAAALAAEQTTAIPVPAPDRTAAIPIAAPDPVHRPSPAKAGRRRVPAPVAAALGLALAVGLLAAASAVDRPLAEYVAASPEAAAEATPTRKPTPTLEPTQKGKGNDDEHGKGKGKGNNDD